MYTPVAQRSGTTDTTSGGGMSASSGYVPVANRPAPAAPQPQEAVSATPFSIDIPSSFKTANSTQAIPDATTGNPFNTTLQITKDVGRGIARSIASTGVTIARQIDPNVPDFKPENYKSLFGQALIENVFGTEPNKSIEDRIVESEQKVKAWGEDLLKLSQTPTLSPHEKLITETLGNLATQHPGKLSFVGIMGSVGIDLTPFGGLEDGAFKALIRAKTEGEALSTLAKMGVSEDLARQFAKDVVQVNTPEDARRLFMSIGNLQMTTKAKPALAEDVARASAQEDAQGVLRAYTPASERLKLANTDTVKVNDLIEKAKNTSLDTFTNGLSTEERVVLRNAELTPGDFYSQYGSGKISLNAPSDLPSLSEVSIENGLENLRQEIAILRDTIDTMPGKDLMRYVSRNTGDLVEISGKGTSKFARRGDALIQDIMGQDASHGGDIQVAQEAVDKYRSVKQRLTELEASYRAAKLNARDEKVLSTLSAKVANENERMAKFAQKYPELFQATLPLTKEATKGAKIGYKVGRVVERTRIIDQLRTRQTVRDSVKAEIVAYAKNNLPLNERGKLLSLVQRATTPKDLIKAFVRIDNRAQELELTKSITKLKETAGKLADSPSISADYRGKIKDIIRQYELTGHTKETIEKLKSTQEYIDRTKAAGGEVTIPQRILDKLQILGRVPKDELTRAQVQGLQGEIELLGKLGETKWATKQALYDNEKELRMKELLDTATPISAKELPKTEIGVKPSFWAQKYIALRNYLQKTRISLTPIEGLADITGMQPMKDALDLNFGNYLTYNDAINKKWINLTKDFTDKQYERIGAYAMSKQSGGLERLANSGITKAEIDAIKLTPEEEKVYKFVRDTFEEEYPAVKQYALDHYNVDVGQVDNYVSFMSDYDAMSDLEMYDRFGVRAEEAVAQRTKTVEQGFTKERAKTAQTKLELNIDKIFRRHTDDVAYMLTMGHDIKQYFEIVNSPAMREKLGNVGTLAWLQYLDLMARKGGVDSAKRIAALDILRKNMGAGVLGFRLSSALVQFTSFADTLGTIGAEYATRGASSIASSRAWRNFVMDNFPEVKKAVGDDIAFREFGEGFLGKMAHVGMAPLQALDGLMRSTAAAGAYAKLAAERGIIVDLAHPNEELLAAATKLMRQSQGSSFFKDQPLAITTGYGITDNRSLNKTILTFQSFMLNRWDNMQRQIWRMGIKERDYKKAIASTFWMVVFSAALEEGIRRGVRSVTNLVTGDDQPEQSFLGNSALNVIQSVPILGSLVSSMSYSSNPIPVVNTFEDLLGGVNSAVQGKAGTTKAKGIVRTLGATGSLSGVPGASQAARLIEKAISPTPGGSGETKTKKIKAPPGLPALPEAKVLVAPPGLPKLPKL